MVPTDYRDPAERQGRRVIKENQVRWAQQVKMDPLEFQVLPVRLVKMDSKGSRE
jgi:hypothetical protein